jgi:hypothetical protein
MDMHKGEEFSWIVEDKNTLIFKRKKARTPRTPKTMESQVDAYGLSPE